MKKFSALLALSLLLPSALPAWTQVVRLAPVESAAFGAAAVVPALASSPAGLAPALSANGVAALSAPTAAAIASAAAALPAASAAAVPAQRPSALTSLSAAAAEPSAPADADGARRFDGAALSPALEPATSAAPEPALAQAERPDEGENLPQRPQLSFQPAAKTALHALEPGAALYGAMKLVKDTPFSRDYWNQYRKGADVDIVIR
ncbi:MAG: hypothetical protein HKL90_08365, partial [Elusimicrobia bacterium]|nr:hypothetical protein [Elusimicrobiota bacterium]